MLESREFVEQAMVQLFQDFTGHGLQIVEIDDHTGRIELLGPNTDVNLPVVSMKSFALAARGGQAVGC
jgi:hypothetical protein